MEEYTDFLHTNASLDNVRELLYKAKESVMLYDSETYLSKSDRIIINRILNKLNECSEDLEDITGEKI